MNSGRLEFEREVGVSRETLSKLERYEELLLRWSAKINLVSKTTLDEIWTRHFLDSAQIFELAPKGVKHWLDIGSGGGFPGLVIGILALQWNPKMTLKLVESDQRKCAFLSTVIRETGLKASVICARVEDLDPMMADVISARALAPLSQLLAHAKRHLSPDGIALFLKGAKSKDELVNALDSWSFRCETHPSKTDTNAVVLSISEIERA